MRGLAILSLVVTSVVEIVALAAKVPYAGYIAAVGTVMDLAALGVIAFIPEGDSAPTEGRSDRPLLERLERERRNRR